MTQPFKGKNKSGLTRKLIEALFSMFEQASAIAIDRNARITWINSSYSELLGLSEAAARKAAAQNARTTRYSLRVC